MFMKFEQFEDMRERFESLEFDSGTVICRMESSSGICEIKVIGEVSVEYNGVIYDTPSKFPVDLMHIINKSQFYFNNCRAKVHRQNWFEIYAERYNQYDETKITMCDVAEIENCNTSELFTLCCKYLDIPTNSTGQYWITEKRED